jgi:orotidine-5'-phosphate decarboxylase
VQDIRLFQRAATVLRLLPKLAKNNFSKFGSIHRRGCSYVFSPRTFALRLCVMRNPIIVALDVPGAERALGLAARLAPFVGAFKIGSELFTSAGPEIVRSIRSTGASVFLDLKFHDIPNTVAKSVAATTRLNVQMLTIHASGGFEMMKAAEAAAQETAQQLKYEPPLVLGVTVLTSMSDPELQEVGVSSTAGAQVEGLAKLAMRAGLRGLVCSPLELHQLRNVLPRTFQLVTPGIRGPADVTGDQKRTMNPKDAISSGADWLVIGRPILSAPDPVKAAQGLLATLASS